MCQNINNSLKSSLRTNLRLNDKDIESLNDLKCLVESKIESKEKCISENRIKLNGSRGVWRSDLGLVQVIQNKGINGWIGSTIDSIRYLQPFEALYLMESQSMEVLFEDIPLSIEQSFELFLQNEEQMDFYRIYGLLSRSGYFVRRQRNEEIISDIFESNLKRKLSDFDIDCNKRLDLNTNYYELSSKITNYKSMVNMRPIVKSLLPKTLAIKTSVDSEDIEKAFNETKHLCKQSIIYDIKDNESPVELNSSEHLIPLFNSDVKPLCDFGSILTNNELFSLIQSFGPKYKAIETKDDFKSELILDVFRHSDNKVDESPSFHVIITKANQTVPQIDEILVLQQKCHSNRIYFAILDSNDITFCSVSPIDLNEEFPVLWQKYLI